MTVAVDERHDLGAAPHFHARDVLVREAEHIGHDDLRQKTGELIDEIDLSVVDPVVDQFVGCVPDHVMVSRCAGADPRIGELGLVHPPEVLIRSEALD